MDDKSQGLFIRVPGSYNVKRDKFCEIIEMTGELHDPALFLDFSLPDSVPLHSYCTRSNIPMLASGAIRRDWDAAATTIKYGTQFRIKTDHLALS